MFVKRFHCPKCRAHLQVGAAYIRPRIKCKHCQKIFRLPAVCLIAVAQAREIPRYAQVTYWSRN